MRERERERESRVERKAKERERKMEEKQEGEGRGPFISSPMCACIYALGFRPKGQCTTEIRLVPRG